MELTAAQQKYFAYRLTRSLPFDSLCKLTASLQDAQVDLTPLQIDAALFAFKSPLSKGAITHCAVLMKKVIEGKQGGVSKFQNWHGGGGYKFYELAPSFLNKDKYDNLVINISNTNITTLFDQ